MAGGQLDSSAVDSMELVGRGGRPWCPVSDLDYEVLAELSFRVSGHIGHYDNINVVHISMDSGELTEYSSLPV